MSNVLINVLGAERTGSTLLDVMLGNGEKCFSCGEVSFLFRPTRTEHFDPKCVCDNKECPVWSGVIGIKEKELYSYLFAHNEIIIDSSKRLNWVIDSYKNAGNNVDIFNIVTWKRYESIVYSFWKRNFNIAKRLKKYHKYYERLENANIPYISICYDEFVQNPSSALKLLCDKINLPYFPGKERFWENKDFHFLYGSLGIRQQVRKGKSIIYKREKKPSNFYQFLKKISDSEREKVQKILSKVEGKNIKNVDLEIFKNPNVKKSIWYFYYKIGRKIKRYYPEEYTAIDVNPLFQED